ncbi:hypothetical protein POM88_011669 [Heracleum sosnowskyi]|uniref:Uncharacterized protein n=1 Tax=Heracleum sosnowskyi TaxID=360622 RepID=A0AAD8N2M5_9APIA|nr:hypothetical protein POM88_011669 [Heracleum sosnowskyi]
MEDLPDALVQYIVSYMNNAKLMQMASSICRLETLVVYCPFTSVGLASWLSSPNWDSFLKLKSLEIVGVRLEDPALKACPNLTHLSLLGCEGLRSVSIELLQLQQCKLDFYGLGNCSLSLTSPKLESLEVQGCGWLGVPETKCLRTLCISNNTGKDFTAL